MKKAFLILGLSSLIGACSSIFATPVPRAELPLIPQDPSQVAESADLSKVVWTKPYRTTQALSDSIVQNARAFTRELFARYGAPGAEIPAPSIKTVAQLRSANLVFEAMSPMQPLLIFDVSGKFDVPMPGPEGTERTVRFSRIVLGFDPSTGKRLTEKLIY